MGVGNQRYATTALPPGKKSGTHCIGGLVGPRAGLDGCEKSRPPNEIRSPDGPARSESLYRLSYPGPHLYYGTFQIDRYVRGVKSHTRTYKPLIYAVAFVPF